MSKKRMVYAEDVIQRIRDLAPEILGGWYNPDMENELEQLVCVVESTPTAADTDVQRWRDPDKDPPKVEEDVLILFETACGGYGITTAHYEDGTLLSQDSIFYWDELAAWGELYEEHDDYIIPKGWWEYRYFNPDDVYNNKIDRPVVGWMPLPEKLKKEGVAHCNGR